MITPIMKQEPPPPPTPPPMALSTANDISNMENSAVEALISLASQDSGVSKPPVVATRLVSPIVAAAYPLPDANHIRKLQHLSDKYITNEPLLKESEKIEMFSEIPTTDSEEEESLLAKRRRYCDLHFFFLFWLF